MSLGQKRNRDFGWDRSLKNPLFLQMYPVLKHIKLYFDELPDNGLKIYDFGCGTKPYRTLVKKNKYIGIDIDPKNTEADILCDISKTPLQSNSGDLSCSFFVLEHVINPNDVINEKFRVLKKRGRLFMVAPLFWEEHEQPYDYFRYTQFSLRHMMETSGFSKINIKPINGRHALLGLNLARFCSYRRFLKYLVPLINLYFYKLHKKEISEVNKSGNNVIHNVMSYSVEGIKE